MGLKRIFKYLGGTYQYFLDFKKFNQSWSRLITFFSNTEIFSGGSQDIVVTVPFSSHSQSQHISSKCWCGPPGSRDSTQPKSTVKESELFWSKKISQFLMTQCKQLIDTRNENISLHYSEMSFDWEDCGTGLFILSLHPLVFCICSHVYLQWCLKLLVLEDYDS